MDLSDDSENNRLVQLFPKEGAKTKVRAKKPKTKVKKPKAKAKKTKKVKTKTKPRKAVLTHPPSDVGAFDTKPSLVEKTPDTISKEQTPAGCQFPTDMDIADHDTYLLEVNERYSRAGVDPAQMMFEGPVNDALCEATTLRRPGPRDTMVDIAVGWHYTPGNQGSGFIDY